MQCRDFIKLLQKQSPEDMALDWDNPGLIAGRMDKEVKRVLLAVEAANDMGINVTVGNVLSSDIYYNAISDANDRWKRMGVLAVEMESAALYANAAYAGKKALGIFSISNHIYKGGELPTEERESGFNDMIRIALEI